MEIYNYIRKIIIENVHTVMHLPFETRSDKQLRNPKLYVKCWE